MGAGYPASGAKHTLASAGVLFLKRGNQQLVVVLCSPLAQNLLREDTRMQASSRPTLSAAHVAGFFPPPLRHA